MPKLFKKSKDDSSKAAELELQQATLGMISNDGPSASAPRHKPAPTWFTPSSIPAAPVRSSTPRSPSRTTSPTFSNQSTLPRSPTSITPSASRERNRTPSIDSKTSFSQRNIPSRNPSQQELRAPSVSGSHTSLAQRGSARPSLSERPPSRTRTPTPSISSSHQRGGPPSDDELGLNLEIQTPSIAGSHASIPQRGRPPSEPAERYQTRTPSVAGSHASIPQRGGPPSPDELGLNLEIRTPSIAGSHASIPQRGRPPSEPVELYQARTPSIAGSRTSIPQRGRPPSPNEPTELYQTRTPSIAGSHASNPQRTRPSSLEEHNQRKTPSIDGSHASFAQALAQQPSATRRSSPEEPDDLDGQSRASSVTNSRASLVHSRSRTRTRTPKPPPKQEQKQNTSLLSKLSKLKLPGAKTRDDTDKTPSRRNRGPSSSSSPSPWEEETPRIVTVITRDGEKYLSVDQLEPHMRPRPVTVPKITRKVQTDPVDDNFQLIPQKEEPGWVATYQKYRKLIWILFFIIVIGLATIIAFAATDNTSDDYDGAFAKFLGQRCTHFCRHSQKYKDTPLVVLALDGFRYDYLDRYQTNLPNLRRLSECGVTADLRPSFPATTAPNLWTIVSGYFPQFHGVISDWILDYKTGEEFAPRADPTGPGTTDAGWFHDPALWELAEEQGKITASHSWLGNNLGIGKDDHHPQGENRSPTYYQTFRGSETYKTRLETVLEWLNLPSYQRPTFITVYFEDPGETGRKYGATSDQVGEVLREIDAAIGHLFDEMLRQQIVDCVNFMVVSTSGLEDTHCDDVYYLSDDINRLEYFTVSPDYLGSMARITPKESVPDYLRNLDTEEEVIDYLQCQVDHGQAYLTDFLPNRLHGAYGHHLEEAVVLMDEGWTFAKQKSGYDQSYCKGANDGYDPFAKNMTGTFIGFGKDFKIGHSIKPFQNTELFNLMTDLIGVKPSSSSPPSDGTPGYLNDVLKQQRRTPSLPWGIATPRNDRCVYPEIRRVPDDGCTCLAEVLEVYPETAGVNITLKDSNLQLIEVPGSSIDRNAPFGLPGVKDNINEYGEYFCILHQNDYITAYDDFLEIPLYVTYTIKSTTGSVPVLENCRRYDQRLDPTKSQMCSEYYNGVVAEFMLIEPAFLFQPELAGNFNTQFDALITSNMVPQYTIFTERIWKPLAAEIRVWAGDAKDMQIVTGVGYDMNHDSTKDSYFEIGASDLWVGDTPVPTHFYLVATQCITNSSDTTMALEDCAYSNIATKAYIFPHTKDIPQCFNFEQYLTNNRASIRDVERLSGLVFFQDWTMNANSQMKMLRFKARYAEDNSRWLQF